MKMQKGGGMLKPEHVTDGMRVLIYSEAENNEYSFTDAKTGKKVEGLNWKVKVRVPDGTKYLAVISEISHDAILDAYGDDSKEWVGHSLECKLNVGKFSTKIMFAPTSDARDMSVVDKPMTPEQQAELDAARSKEQAGRDAVVAAAPSADEIPF